MHDTTIKAVEILADLSDQYKNDGNADENDGRGNRPLDRSLYRPFKKRRSEENRHRDEGSKPRMESEKRNCRREKQDRKRTVRRKPKPKPNAKVKKYTDRLKA
jgi:hypothetical protein